MNLPGFEPSEEDLYRQAIAVPLDRKIDMAINLIGTMCENRRHLLAFSGGKDSIVIKELARLAGIQVNTVYSVTTIDPPELIRYIQQHHSDVPWRRQKIALLQRLAEGPHGPPTRTLRWCCQEYKENTGRDYDVRIIGVRAEESVRRRGLWKLVNADRYSSGTIMAPIVYWTDEDIWTFIRKSRLPYCCLYDEGFKRLGCVGCPLAGPRVQRMEFDRWPGFERVWKRAFHRFWDRWYGIPTRTGTRRWFEGFGNADNLWQWWVTGRGMIRNDSAMIQQSLELEYDECDADCQSRYVTL